MSFQKALFSLMLVLGAGCSGAPEPPRQTPDLLPQEEPPPPETQAPPTDALAPPAEVASPLPESGQLRVQLLEGLLEDDALWRRAARLPGSVVYWDRETWELTVEATPEVYLFDVRTWTGGQGVVQVERPYTMFWGLYDHVCLAAHGREEPLDRPDWLALLQVLYDVVRSPSSKERELLLALVDRVPPHLRDPVLARHPEDFETARELFASSLELRCVPIVKGTMPEVAGAIAHTSRAANGELLLTSRVDCGGGNWALPPVEEERSTAFARFLYRRGPAFTESAGELVDEYRARQAKD